MGENMNYSYFDGVVRLESKGKGRFRLWFLFYWGVWGGAFMALCYAKPILPTPNKSNSIIQYTAYI